MFSSSSPVPVASSADIWSSIFMIRASNESAQWIRSRLPNGISVFPTWNIFASIEAAYRAGAQRYFFSSSACVYNTQLQQDPNVRPLRESDAYPAMAERGYGWEKLISEMVCQEYWSERGMKTFIARFHNVYGPAGTWDGGREKAPAALCRKAAEAADTGVHTIEIWGDGHQSRSFMYIDDCVKGVDMIMHSDELVATPVNLGSSELVSINKLVEMVESIAGVKLERKYDLTAPRGVGGRNSDNTFIQQILHWEPNTDRKST